MAEDERERFTYPYLSRNGSENDFVFIENYLDSSHLFLSSTAINKSEIIEESPPVSSSIQSRGSGLRLLEESDVGERGDDERSDSERGLVPLIIGSENLALEGYNKIAKVITKAAVEASLRVLLMLALIKRAKEKRETAKGKFGEPDDEDDEYGVDWIA